jgi:3-phytase
MYGGLSLLAACAGAALQPVTTATVVVPAAGETTAVASLEDAADDPAIWIDRNAPARSLIVATDKKAGLNVYGLDGSLKSSLAAGRVNNVDLRQVGAKVIVAASDRNDVTTGKLALFELTPATATLRTIASIPAELGEAYGLCLYKPRSGPLYAFVVAKDGAISQIEIDLSNASGKVVRRMKLATQSEGCVADDRTGQLYVGEEDVGIWRFGADPGDGVNPIAVAKVDGQRLVADTEGLAIAAAGKAGGYLIASSQGDNAYVLWQLPSLAYVGRFRIAPSGAIGGTSETDGIDVTTASLPGYPGGLMIAQDGDNAPKAQNFKLVRWADVVKALMLKR